MNTHRITLLLAGSIGLTLADIPAQSPSGRYGWNQFPTTPTAAPNVQKATVDTESFGLSKFAGKPLRGSNQEELGSVTDFLIETQTGRIRYALVPSGGGRSGDTYRLVPMTAVDSGSNNDALVVHINRDQWNRVGTMTEAELPGRVSLSAESEQRFARQFGTAWSAQSDVNDFTRASKWKGQTVHAQNEQLGSIDDVVLDLSNRTASALLKPSGGYAPANTKFVVPFEQLQLTGDPRAPIVTNLTRNDFQAAAGAYLPTGTTSGQFNQFGQQQSNLYSAASTVQQALNREPSLLAGAGVQVMPETRLVLRGTAQNNAQRAAIENVARQSAPNLVIENQISVQGR